ncbi:MAG: hypothetical protein GXZ15_04105 [Campylobacter sp.]|nr:hypothetical protein [Campylobacter sp.]
MDIGLMLIVTIVVGMLIYQEIQKQSQKLNEKELNPDMSRYIKFCDSIDMEISNLRQNINLGDLSLKDSEQKSNFLEELSTLSKELVFLQNSHSTNKNSTLWEEKLAEFLAKFEDIVTKYSNDSQEINDKIRKNLQAKF